MQMSLSDVRKAPQDFLYLFATDGFLAKLDATTARNVRIKRTNQSKLLNTACQDAGKPYKDMVAEINQLLIDNFEHSGTECLKILADGGEIAGKDWSKGIYGIGATTYEGFAGTDITVNAETGKLMQGGQEIAGQTAIYGKNSTTYTALVNGTTYTSQYKGGKYSAGTYTTTDGKVFNPTGKEAGLASFSNIWASIQSLSPMIEQMISWLSSLFPDIFAGKSMLTAKDTVPSQKDGFIQNAGVDIATVGIFAGIAAAVYALASRRKNK